ncbi:protein HOS4-like isoform X2 [Vicia villosa]|uniref:protein HOS4-like isoform X2 n=1 Tax=Vicia villosa TaxID=3911 RepID=UPI00273B046F|nr:protein HOS4-like isoform X2 [Vicia villosa]
MFSAAATTFSDGVFAVVVCNGEASAKDVSRLQQIRECIRTIEKSKLKEDIQAHRQRKLLMRHDRQTYLDEAALRETEILQELDRERVAEMEKEMERQKLLEIERPKTRELRYNLDMEKEKQVQGNLKPMA